MLASKRTLKPPKCPSSDPKTNCATSNGEFHKPHLSENHQPLHARQLYTFFGNPKVSSHLNPSSPSEAATITTGYQLTPNNKAITQTKPPTTTQQNTPSHQITTTTKHTPLHQITTNRLPKSTSKQPPDNQKKKQTPGLKDST